MPEHFLIKCVNSQNGLGFEVHISTIVAFNTYAGRWYWFDRGSFDFTTGGARDVPSRLQIRSSFVANTQIRMEDLAKAVVNFVARKCKHRL
jgi:hypothetical protein